MLTHSEVKVPPGVAPCRVAAPSGDMRVVRGRQIGGASDEPGDALRDRVDGQTRGGAGGDGLVGGCEVGKIGIPPRRKPPLERSGELRSQLWVRLLIRQVARIPGRLQLLSSLQREPHAR